jgi:hypothetical protein
MNRRVNGKPMRPNQDGLQAGRFSAMANAFCRKTRAEQGRGGPTVAGRETFGEHHPDKPLGANATRTRARR